MMIDDDDYTVLSDMVCDSSFIDSLFLSLSVIHFMIYIYICQLFHILLVLS